jgi:hypothetical protein
VDGSGTIYVADSGNHTIRTITPAGEVTTLAGQAGVSGSADGTGAAATFNGPAGIDVDAAGTIWVTDLGSHTVRRVSPAGEVTTVAGTPGQQGDADGTGPTARFAGPVAIAAGDAGVLFVVDSTNHAIRRGVPALPDAAVIDSGTGTVGQARQLDAQPRTATSWSWSVVRRPGGSTAQLSSTTIPNPTFTPDVADRYEFLLVASLGTGLDQQLSITTVTLDTLAGETLSLTKDGAGSGTVTSSPPGLSCNAACSAISVPFPTGTAVTLTAAASSGSAFTGWSGACSGTGTCQVTMDQARSVTATFEPTYTLEVALAGTGSGSVGSSPAGIDCGSTCSAAFVDGTVVTLSAAPGGGSSFTGWSGACSGTGSCQVTMDEARSVTATFTAGAPCGVVLEGQTIDTTETFESCDTLKAGPTLAIVSPGNVTLRAAQAVILRNGFSVGSGARLTAALDASLAP